MSRSIVPLVALAMILIAAAPCGQAAEPAPPNIIVILADDLGYGDLGCYGQRRICTPQIDRLAAEGIRFTQHYSGNAVCAPSRCCLMTGKHPGHAFIRDNSEVKPEGQRPIPAATVTIAELLKERGYATAATGKWGLGPPGSEGDPNRQGFDLFFGYNCQRHAHNYYPRYLWRNNERIWLEGNAAGVTGKHYSHDLIEAEALRFIDEHRASPFFLYVPFTIPHLALQVPEDSLKQYLGKWDDPPYHGDRGYQPQGHPRAAYAAMVTRMDRSVGRIVERIKQLGLDRNTVVMFSSDNGPTHDRIGGSDAEFFNSAGSLRGLKGTLYEGGIRVPMIVRWPGKIGPKRTTDLPSAFWDLLPTLCEIAGASPPPDIDGVSFLPTLLGNDRQKKHEYLYWEFCGYGGQQAVRFGNWKALRKDLHKGNTNVELYNLADDAGESTDVAARHPDIVARLARIMAESHTPSASFPFRVLDDPRAPRSVLAAPDGGN